MTAEQIPLNIVTDSHNQVHSPAGAKKDYPAKRGVCVNHLFAKVFSSYACRGIISIVATTASRGAHTDSSANKAGLYVVRISLGTLSDVPAKGGQDPYPPEKSGAFPFGETRFSGSDERNSTCPTCCLYSCM